MDKKKGSKEEQIEDSISKWYTGVAASTNTKKPTDTSSPSPSSTSSLPGHTYIAFTKHTKHTKHPNTQNTQTTFTSPSNILAEFVTEVIEDPSSRSRIGGETSTARARDIQNLKMRGLEWVPDDLVTACSNCAAAFSVVARRVRRQRERKREREKCGRPANVTWQYVCRDEHTNTSQYRFLSSSFLSPSSSFSLLLSLISAQHHCRLCGKIFCATCCPKNREVPFPHILNHNYPVRVCCRCYAVDPIDAHTAAVLTIHLMRTGEILSGSADGTVRVWEVMWEVDQTSGGQCIATLCGHTADVTGDNNDFFFIGAIERAEILNV